MLQFCFGYAAPLAGVFGLSSSADYSFRPTKSLTFFVALLPQFINANHAIAPQVLLLGVTSVIIEFFVLAAYGSLAARAASMAREPKFVVVTNRVSGGMLVVAGAGIALSTER